MSKDLRDAFFDALFCIGRDDPNVIILTNDMDVFALREFKKSFPKQFINVGVAEQNMINVAAGLARCGKKVWVYGISSFVTFRCFEQIKFNICSMNLPVTIVGMGAGVSFGSDGPTHHAIQDISVMRSLPEMHIWNPPDAASAEICAELSYRSSCSMYVRIDKGIRRSIYETEQQVVTGYKVVRPLRMVNIISTGYMTHILSGIDWDVGIVDISRLKPINEDILQILYDSETIICVEDNARSGGLGTILSEIIADNALHTRLKRVSFPDRQFFDYASRDWFHEKYELTLGHVKKLVYEN